MKTLRHISAVLLVGICTSFAASATSAPTPLIVAKDVENPALPPFQGSQKNVPFPVDQRSVNVNFVVPAGKRLVIEYASGTVLLAQGRATAFLLTTIVNGVSASHSLTFTSTGPQGNFPLSYSASQQVHLYADPGTTVIFSVQRDMGGDGVVHATVSGHLVAVSLQEPPATEEEIREQREAPLGNEFPPEEMERRKEETEKRLSPFDHQQQDD